MRYHDSGAWAADTTRAINRAERFLADHADATGSRRPAYKARSRRAIERRGYRILVNASDPRSDLSARPEPRQVKLPNPMYVTR